MPPLGTIVFEAFFVTRQHKVWAYVFFGIIRLFPDKKAQRVPSFGHNETFNLFFDPVKRMSFYLNDCGKHLVFFRHCDAFFNAIFIWSKATLHFDECFRPENAVDERKDFFRHYETFARKTSIFFKSQFFDV